MSLALEVRRRSPASDDTVNRWIDRHGVDRLWAKDPTVWFDPPRDEVANRLGWLDLPIESRSLLGPIAHLAEQATAEGITDIVLCGMGGSSLAPEVFAASLPTADGSPRLTVADTTHPDHLLELRNGLDPTNTWWIVSSKSGGTLETLSLFRYFWDFASSSVSNPGRHFVAVTDAGSSLAALGEARDFRSVVLANPDVGGRYSALSAFGLVPAGIIGADLEQVLDHASAAAGACRTSTAENPGLAIGAVLGSIAADGLSGAYFTGSSIASSVPAWIEQLIAESTGKEGVGILPIAAGAISPPDAVLTVALGPTIPDTADIAIGYDDPHAVGAAMFVLEFATAVAGEALGINPFDQPDVQLAKTLAVEAMEGSGAGERVDYMTDPRRVAEALARNTEDAVYIAVQAFLAPSADTESALERLARTVSSRFNVPTTVGLGPRFLHSTGQLHKGGQPGGIYLQLIDEPHATLTVPEASYTFNTLIRAQAEGDASALHSRGRAVIPVNLGAEATRGIDDIARALR